MNSLPLDEIRLSNLVIDCVVGIYPSERVKTQPLVLALSMMLPSPAGKQRRLHESVDYARLSAEARFLLQSARFPLIEEAAEVLASHILSAPTADAPRAQVQEVTIVIDKPKAVSQAMPSIRITRRRSTDRANAGAQTEVLWEDTGGEHRVSVQRLHLAPHSHLATEPREGFEFNDLLLGAGLQVQGQPARRGTVCHWPMHLHPRYENPTSVDQTILRVMTPIEAGKTAPSELVMENVYPEEEARPAFERTVRRA